MFSFKGEEKENEIASYLSTLVRRSAGIELVSNLQTSTAHL